MGAARRSVTTTPSSPRVVPSVETCPSPRGAWWPPTASTSSIRELFHVNFPFFFPFFLWFRHGQFVGEWQWDVYQVSLGVIHYYYYYYFRFYEFFSGCGNVFRRSSVVAPLPVHRFRHSIPHYAHYQRLPLFGHDLFMFKDRSHRKGTEHHRRIRPLPKLAWITIRIAVGLLTFKAFFFFFLN